MRNWLRCWRDERARVRDAERRALAAFEATGRGRGYMMWVVRADERETVIRVCFGDTRPPHRSWFLVPSELGAPVRELSYDEVVPMGESTAWR
jgi:hypothetical protein